MTAGSGTILSAAVLVDGGVISGCNDCGMKRSACNCEQVQRIEYRLIRMLIVSFISTILTCMFMYQLYLSTVSSFLNWWIIVIYNTNELRLPPCYLLHLLCSPFESHPDMLGARAVWLANLAKLACVYILVVSNDQVLGL